MKLSTLFLSCILAIPTICLAANTANDLNAYENQLGALSSPDLSKDPSALGSQDLDGLGNAGGDDLSLNDNDDQNNRSFTDNSSQDDNSYGDGLSGSDDVDDLDSGSIA